MTFRGTIVNGRVELEAGAVIPEGTVVRVEPVGNSRLRKPTATGGGWRALTGLGVKTGISDLADEHDHYVYGTPKRRSRKQPVKTKPARRRKT